MKAYIGPAIAILRLSALTPASLGEALDPEVGKNRNQRADQRRTETTKQARVQATPPPRANSGRRPIATDHGHRGDPDRDAPSSHEFEPRSDVRNRPESAWGGPEPATYAAMLMLSTDSAAINGYGADFEESTTSPLKC